MTKKIFASILIAAGIIVLSSESQAQQTTETNASSSIIVTKGRVYSSLKSRQLSKSQIEAQLAGMLGLSAKHNFLAGAVTKDKAGFEHVNYQQYYSGVPVDGGKILVHYKAGIANSINGRIAMLGNMAVVPTINAEEATLNAKTHLQVSKTINAYETQLVIVAENVSKETYALAYKVRVDGKNATGKIVMTNVFVDAITGRVLKAVSLMAHADVTASAQTKYSGIQTITTDSYPEGYRLRDNARKIETYNAAGAEMSDTGSLFFLDAKDYNNTTTTWSQQPALMNMSLTTVTNNMLNNVGFQTGFVASFVVRGNSLSLDTAELAAWPDIKFTNSSTQPLPVESHNLYVFPRDTNYTGAFGKINLFGNGDISDTAFFRLQHITPGTYPWIDAQGNGGTYQISNEANPALDAHWGMEVTHDYYTETFGRNSYDGNGSVVKNYINGIWPSSLDQNNAAALPAPYFSMVYGMGDGENADAFVALDVMGHEFTHMVTETNGNGGLDYEGESGALNESFSDIFGTAIEFYAKGAAANWQVGEDITFGSGFLRSMSNPKLAQNPDTYEGQYWIDPTDLSFDNGGVHINSGIQNKWFYLLVQGGTGTNDNGDVYNVPAIGMAKAAQIAYRNLTNYLTPTADFMDAYSLSLQATDDLYGDTSAAYTAVKEAWFAVGIGEKDSATSVNDISVSANDLRLYPNPATGRVNISSNLNQEINAQIVNVVGVPVMNIQVSKGINPIDISTLVKGIYLIRYETGSRSYVQKLSVL